MQTKLKLLYHKDSGVMFFHAVLSFSPDEEISLQRTHEFALRYAAEQFPGSQVVVATHHDRDHIHSHLVINSVNMETGRKLHLGGKDMARLMQATDDLCLRFGLSVCKPSETDARVKPMSDAEYRIAAKGESWKIALDCDIVECMKLARNRKEFVDLMEAEGYKVKWTDNRKNITYTLPSGKKCRDDRLHDPRYLKEEMEREFRIRAADDAGRIAEEQSAQQPDRRQGGKPGRGKRTKLAGVGFDDEGLHAGDGATAWRTATVGNTGNDGGDAERPVQLYAEPTGTAGGEQHAIPEPSEPGERELADRPAPTGWEVEREQFYLARGGLHIRRTMGRLHDYDEDAKSKTKIFFGEPKTKNSKRYIPLPQSAQRELKEWRERQKREAKQAGDFYSNPMRLVVTNENGGLVGPRTFRDHYERMLVAADLPHFTCHALRHTFATRALERKMDFKTLSMILGHASVAFTMDTCAHVQDELKRKAMDLMDDLYAAE